MTANEKLAEAARALVQAYDAALDWHERFPGYVVRLKFALAEVDAESRKQKGPPHE